MTRHLTEALETAIGGLIDAARDTTDDARAYALVADLSPALRRLPELLAAVPALADTAMLGRARREDLDRLLAELAEREAEAAERAAVLAELRPVAERLRERAATCERLTAELTELRRLEELGAGLETIRAQHARLAERRAELTEVAEEERRLGEAVRDLHRLATTELAALDERIAAAVAEAADTEAAVAAARAREHAERADLARLTAELAELRAEADRRLPSLRLHRQAEQEIIQGLAGGSLTKSTGLRLARQALDDLDDRLAEIDARLKTALKLHDDAYARAREVLPLTD